MGGLFKKPKIEPLKVTRMLDTEDPALKEERGACRLDRCTRRRSLLFGSDFRRQVWRSAIAGEADMEAARASFEAFTRARGIIAPDALAKAASGRRGSQIGVFRRTAQIDEADLRSWKDDMKLRERLLNNLGLVSKKSVLTFMRGLGAKGIVNPNHVQTWSEIRDR
jgi:hypothetical protein